MCAWNEVKGCVVKGGEGCPQNNKTLYKDVKHIHTYIYIYSHIDIIALEPWLLARLQARRGAESGREKERVRES